MNGERRLMTLLGSNAVCFDVDGFRGWQEVVAALGSSSGCWVDFETKLVIPNLV